MIVLYFIKKYPFSITLVLTVLYLSFAKPPQVEIMYFPYMDKVVHFCMYAGISGVLWLEFFLNYRKCEILPVRHALIGAVLCPIIFGGLIEIGQHYLTSYRGGEWLDLLANTTGVIAGSLVSWIFVRKLFRRKESASGKRHR